MDLAKIRGVSCLLYSKDLAFGDKARKRYEHLSVGFQSGRAIRGRTDRQSIRLQSRQVKGVDQAICGIMHYWPTWFMTSIPMFWYTSQIKHGFSRQISNLQISWVFLLSTRKLMKILDADIYTRWIPACKWVCEGGN